GGWGGGRRDTSLEGCGGGVFRSVGVTHPSGPRILERGHAAAKNPAAPTGPPRRVFRGTLARPSSREIPIWSVAFAAKTLYVPASPRRYYAKAGKRNSIDWCRSWGLLNDYLVTANGRPDDAVQADCQRPLPRCKN